MLRLMFRVVLAVSVGLMQRRDVVASAPPLQLSLMSVPLRCDNRRCQC